MQKTFAAKITKFMAAATAAALLFCACSVNEGLRLPTITTASGPVDDAVLREIILAVDASGGDIFSSAAENFCEKATSLSKSGVSFTAKKAEDPFLEIKSGRAGLALVSGQKAGESYSFFNMAAERFRYASYEDFSTTCNSAGVLSALSDACGMQVFAAYYTGSNMLVSNAPLDKLIGGGRASNQEAAPPTASVLGIPGSGTADILSPFCQSAAEAASLPERIISLSVPDAIAEFAPDELARTGFTQAYAYEVVAEAAGSIGGEIPPDAYPESLVFTRTFHTIAPAWLVLAPSLYESLPRQARAAIDEAAAGMCKDIDKLYLDREQAAFDMLIYENMGAQQGSFALTRSRVTRYVNERRAGVSAGERGLLGALDRLR